MDILTSGRSKTKPRVTKPTRNQTTVTPVPNHEEMLDTVKVGGCIESWTNAFKGSSALTGHAFGAALLASRTVLEMGLGGPERLLAGAIGVFGGFAAFALGSEFLSNKCGCLFKRFGQSEKVGALVGAVAAAGGALALALLAAQGIPVAGELVQSAAGGVVTSGITPAVCAIGAMALGSFPLGVAAFGQVSSEKSGGERT
jgi:hypothetical protein